MNQEWKSLFPDQEPTSIPKKPKWVQPMGKMHSWVAMAVSAVLAMYIWNRIKDNLYETSNRNISSMQSQAGEKWSPLIIDTTSSTITTKVTEVITGKEEPKNTVIINPPGQEPAIQVITPDATITASKTGEVETITPKEDTTEKPLTPNEAKSTVKEALNDAAEKTLPKEEPLKPTEPQEEKK